VPQLTAGRLAILTLLALASCGPGRGARDSYRDAGLSLYSNAVFDPARLEGEWAQVAAFQRANGGLCSGGSARFGAPGPDGRLRLDTALCLSGRSEAFSGMVDLPASGRLSLSGADPRGIGQPWWILWADVDNRTLVIGTPSGDFGFILNRGGPLPSDRLKAARDILEWGGYDLTQLTVF
jgi:apolipoprotein D and lipocalin family protein